VRLGSLFDACREEKNAELGTGIDILIARRVAALSNI
jgi:hypothetical protein